MIKIINDLFKRFITGLSGDIVDTSDESLGKDSPNHDGQVSETEYAGLEPNFSLDTLKDRKTRSHTDGFQRNNAKCLDEKGISRFVPHSSI